MLSYLTFKNKEKGSRWDAPRPFSVGTYHLFSGFWELEKKHGLQFWILFLFFARWPHLCSESWSVPLQNGSALVLWIWTQLSREGNGSNRADKAHKVVLQIIKLSLCLQACWNIIDAADVMWMHLLQYFFFILSPIRKKKWERQNQLNPLFVCSQHGLCRMALKHLGEGGEAANRCISLLFLQPDKSFH